MGPPLDMCVQKEVTHLQSDKCGQSFINEPDYGGMFTPMMTFVIWADVTDAPAHTFHQLCDTLLAVVTYARVTQGICTHE